MIIITENIIYKEEESKEYQNLKKLNSPYLIKLVNYSFIHVLNIIPLLFNIFKYLI
jgi:hypothetical protein